MFVRLFGYLELLTPISSNQFSNPVNGTVKLKKTEKIGETSQLWARTDRSSKTKMKNLLLHTGLFRLVCSSRSWRISRIPSCWKEFDKALKGKAHSTWDSASPCICEICEQWPGEGMLKATCGHLLVSTSHLTFDTRRCRWNWEWREHERVSAISHHALFSVHRKEATLNTPQTYETRVHYCASYLLDISLEALRSLPASFCRPLAYVSSSSALKRRNVLVKQ